MEMVSMWREMAQLRSDVGDSWKWPSPVDCVRFAFQELAEADDELMRMESPEFLRRRDETGNSYEQELGMCALMLLSYFRTEDEVREAMSRKPPRASVLVADAAVVAMNLTLGWTLAVSSTRIALPRVLYTIDLIAEMIGEDRLADALLLAIAKIRNRVAEKGSKKYKYLKAGAVNCPDCGSDDIDTRSTDSDDTYLVREVVCCNCGKRWKDIYELVDAEIE